MAFLRENENVKRSVDNLLLEPAMWLTLAGYLRVDPHREFLRSGSAARGRGPVYFGFLLRLTVAKIISDILLKNHTFTGRKGGQGGIRQH